MGRYNGRLREPGRALEQEFFTISASLHEELGRERVAWEERAQLSLASGISDEGVLRLLVDMDVSLDVLSAMALVPLVEVAWADGRMDPKEREAILRAAEAHGVQAGSPAHALVSGWLGRRPRPVMMQAWESYIQAVLEPLLEEERDDLRRALVGRAREVARAAGGFLGFGAISEEEEAVLERLERAMAPDAGRPS